MLADDHDLMRRGFAPLETNRASSLRESSVGESDGAGTTAEADVAVMDLAMPD